MKQSICYIFVVCWCNNLTDTYCKVILDASMNHSKPSFLIKGDFLTHPVNVHKLHSRTHVHLFLKTNCSNETMILSKAMKEPVKPYLDRFQSNRCTPICCHLINLVSTTRYTGPGSSKTDLFNTKPKRCLVSGG